MSMVKPLAHIEERLIVGLEIRRHADGYWQIDGLTSCGPTIREADHLPLVSGKKAIAPANVRMLQGLIMEQLRSLVTLTGEWEAL
jgi:hypothetical protein